MIPVQKNFVVNLLYFKWNEKGCPGKRGILLNQRKTVAENGSGCLGIFRNEVHDTNSAVH